MIDIIHKYDTHINPTLHVNYHQLLIRGFGLYQKAESFCVEIMDFCKLNAKTL